MDITDLNAAGAHHYRTILHEMHMASLALNEDQTTALVELLNEKISELLWRMHHGKPSRLLIHALKTAAGNAGNGSLRAPQELVPA